MMPITEINPVGLCSEVPTILEITGAFALAGVAVLSLVICGRLISKDRPVHKPTQ